MNLSDFVTPTRLKALQSAEQRNRKATADMGLTAKPVEVGALILLQRGKCVCGKCNSLPLDFESEWSPASAPPGYPVIAHKVNRAKGGDHIVGNVWLWRHECNAREARSETSGAAKGDRFEPAIVEITEKRERKAVVKSRSLPTGRKLPTKADKKRVMERMR